MGVIILLLFSYDTFLGKVFIGGQEDYENKIYFKHLYWEHKAIPLLFMYNVSILVM